MVGLGWGVWGWGDEYLIEFVGVGGVRSRVVFIVWRGMRIK